MFQLPPRKAARSGKATPWLTSEQMWGLITHCSGTDESVEITPWRYTPEHMINILLRFSPKISTFRKQIQPLKIKVSLLACQHLSSFSFFKVHTFAFFLLSSNALLLLLQHVSWAHTAQLTHFFHESLILPLQLSGWTFACIWVLAEFFFLAKT